MPEIPAVYVFPSAMEPLLPRDTEGRLRAAAATLMQKSALLSGALHPLTRENIANLVQQMNSYYSNLIEGHQTHPVDIERALNNDLAATPSQRNLQLESRAHIEVQRSIDARMDAEPVKICSTEFLLWMHSEFYRRLPDEFLNVKTTSGGVSRVVPGELRKREAQVGKHMGAAANALPAFLARFEDYEPERHDPLDRIIAWAAAHHRLAWIHPFLDGNGRVTRLFSHAYARKIGIGSFGLWSIARGLARRRDDYFARLVAADETRRNDFDGRGNLSDEGLREFCQFFLDVAIDQVDFIASLLELDSLQERVMKFGSRWSLENDFPERLPALLRDLLVRGSMSRGEAARILGNQSRRTSTRLLGTLLSDGLVVSATRDGPLRLAFSTKTVGYYLPRLYPEGML